MRTLGTLLFASVAALAAACGGSAPADPTSTTRPPTATKEAPSTPVGHTPTVEEPDTTSEPVVSSCADPYLDGAPDGVVTGRLRPTASAPPIPAFQPAALSEDASLRRVVDESIGEERAHFAVVVKRLDDGSGVAVDPGRTFYPASLFKLWVMLEAFKQREAGLIDFDERYVVASYYESLRLNDGELTPCSAVSVSDMLYAMITYSDNVAANMLYDRLGYSNVNDTLRQLGLGYSGLLTGGDLQTTAGGMATIFEAIGHGEAISTAASSEMVSLLEAQAINDRIPALLPPGTRVAHKTGNWDNVTHDVGIVYSPNADYVMVVLTDYGYQQDGATHIARLSKAVYDYYNPT